MEDQLDYTKYRTIIYSPIGYYGSNLIWNDASFAFKHRFERIFGGEAWEYLTNDREYLAKKMNVDIDVLPEWDYEFCVIDR